MMGFIKDGLYQTYRVFSVQLRKPAVHDIGKLN